MKGRVWIDSFDDGSAVDPRYREARKRVDVVIHHEWPPGRVDARTPVTIKLKDGRTFSREISTPREPTLNELLDRYREAADGILSRDRTENSIELLLGMDRVKDVSEIMALVTLKS